MTNYRTDTRPNIGTFVPRGIYEDQPSSHRPDDCRSEIAFADSMGGAIYGGGQNMFAYDSPDPKDFLDETPVARLYIYKTDQKHDYKPFASTRDHVLSIVADFEMMGEVRYCEPVDVEYVSYIDITKRMSAVLQTLIYTGHEVFFDFERIEPTWREWTWEKINEEEKRTADGYKRIIQGDHEFIKEHLLPEPEEWGGWEDGSGGMNEEVVHMVMEEFEKHYVPVTSPRTSRGVGRRGWFGEPQRHALAARGVRTR